jgi:uncharacterized protein (UPF0297 family)
MPNTACDDDAIRALWNECRTREPDCTTDLILQKVSEKLTMKGWNRIHNPVGFLLISVPCAIEASSNATKLCIQDRAEHERALAQNEEELLLEHEREMKAGETAEREFEALPEQRKQVLVTRERRRLLREHPEYRDRLHLPAWQQGFRSKAIRTLSLQIHSSTHDCSGKEANHDAPKPS